jgi:hypothetical protein
MMLWSPMINFWVVGFGLTPPDDDLTAEQAAFDAHMGIEDLGARADDAVLDLTVAHHTVRPQRGDQGFHVDAPDAP